jgi:hypothetical protein
LCATHDVIFDDGELTREATVRLFRTVQIEGGREVTREVEHYNLDMILALGFRVRSPVGVRFRQWANDKLKEYIIKGFVLDDERLKNPGKGRDYFDELTRRLQDKVHFAIHGQTAAELVAARADSSLPNMGLTTWEGARIRKSDVSIAKNYLDEDELRALNNLAEQYLIFAEGQAARRIAMTMQDWITKLEGFLTLNDREILQGAGKVSADLAKVHAEQEFDKFRVLDDQRFESDFDRMVKELPARKQEKEE